MMKHIVKCTILLFLFIVLILGVKKYLFAQENVNANALFIENSGDRTLLNKIEKQIKFNGGKIIHYFPPHVFIGNIPANIDLELITKFGLTIYRNKIDVSIVEKYGETAISAVYIWNQNFVKEPISVPTISLAEDEKPVSGKQNFESSSMPIQEDNKLKTFKWMNIPNASHYHIQISSFPSFSYICTDTIVNKNKYNINTTFLENGTYYLRISALNLLNQPLEKAIPSNWSVPISFMVMGTGKNILSIPKDILPLSQVVKGKKTITWQEIPKIKYYRIQISSSSSFESLFVDEVTAKPYYKTTNSALQFGSTYYWRIMATDEDKVSYWSNTSTLIIDFPEPITGDVLYSPK